MKKTVNCPKNSGITLMRNFMKRNVIMFSIILLTFLLSGCKPDATYEILPLTDGIYGTVKVASAYNISSGRENVIGTITLNCNSEIKEFSGCIYLHISNSNSHVKIYNKGEGKYGDDIYVYAPNGSIITES